MAWARNGTPSTLSSSGSDLDITDLTASKFNQFLIHSLNTGGETTHRFTLDNNENTDYARRRSNNGGADTTTTSQSQIVYYGGTINDKFEMIYGVNIDSEEKLFIHFIVTHNTTGAGYAPDRGEAVSKADTTTNTGQYTRFDCHEDTSGSFDTGSNITAIGTN